MAKGFSLLLALILLGSLPVALRHAPAATDPGVALHAPAPHPAAQEPLDEFVYLPLVLRGMTLVFVADHTTINQGESVTLSWVVQGAVSVYLNGILVAATGSSFQTPLVTTTYTLSAMDAEGNWMSAYITITVIPGYYP